MSGDSQPRPNMLRTLWPCGSVNSRNLYVKVIAPFVTKANRPFAASHSRGTKERAKDAIGKDQGLTSF